MLGCEILHDETALHDENALEVLKLDSLEKRRDKLTLNFAKSSLKLEKMKRLFPLNENNHGMVKRNFEKYKVTKAKTERYKSSAVINIQRMLNDEVKENNLIYQRVVSHVLRTCDSIEPVSS